jgi:hypothetical protein
MGHLSVIVDVAFYREGDNVRFGEAAPLHTSLAE